MYRLIAISTLAITMGFVATPASAIVYCKTVGVPKGCVARPVVKPVVVAPVTVVPAPAAAIAAPKPGNLNGGVNRVGRVR